MFDLKLRLVNKCSLIYCIRKKEGTIFHFHLTLLFSGGSKITINGEGFSNVGSVTVDNVVSIAYIIYTKEAFNEILCNILTIWCKWVKDCCTTQMKGLTIWRCEHSTFWRNGDGGCFIKEKYVELHSWSLSIHI